jgi:hypothetical protein
VSASLALRHLHDALWQDEVASARVIAQPSLAAVLHRVQQTESTPPLWYVLAWLLHRAGMSLTALRLLSVLATAAGAGLLVLLARRVLPLGSAALSGLFVAMGAEFVGHGHELRAYALLIFITLLFAVVLEAEVSRPSRRREGTLAAVVAAGLLTHYFFAFCVLGGLSWLWWERDARTIRRRASTAIVAGAAVSALWLPFAIGQYRHDRFWWIGPFAIRQLVNTPFQIFSPFSLHTVGAVVPVLALAVMLIGALLLVRGGRVDRLTAILAIGPLLAAGLAWWAGLRIFATRNLVETGPFLAIALARAIAATPKRIATLLALAAAAAIVAGYVRSQRGDPTPFDAIAHALVAEGWHVRDPIAVFGSFFAFRAPLEWYLPAHPPLALSASTAGTCHALFVIKHRSAADRAGGVEVAGFAVERLTDASSIEHILLQPSRHLLADPLIHGCVRAVSSGRYSAWASSASAA